jgi:DNA (cytosine-5)-methyltransferase 1
MIPVSNVQAYKQFGNSVSVPVIRAIAKEIKKQLLK